MKVIVTGCWECPLKRVSNQEGIFCKMTDEMLTGPNDGDVDVVTTKGFGARCPMRTDRLQFVMEKNKLGEINGYVEAFLGNRVRLHDGSKALVVGKFGRPEDLAIDPALIKPDVAGKTVYLVIIDGGESMYMFYNGIKEILSDLPVFNHHKHFKWYFGHDDEG